MLELPWIQKQVRKNQYYFTGHGDLERMNDNLAITEIEEAILTGKIIENYPDTGRGESCLIAGFTDTGKPIHAVCGIRGDWPVIITVYIPSPPKFVTPYERSKQ